MLEVVETVERQLSHMSYFNQSGLWARLRKHAPTTNLRAESEFTKRDDRVAVCGGSANVLCYFRKNSVVTNRLSVDVYFTEKRETKNFRNGSGRGYHITLRMTKG